MKLRFPGFYPLKQDEIDDFFSDAVIVFDTESLLNFFRISPSNSAHLFSLLEDSRVKEKLWIPYDVAWLYHQKMNEEILHQREYINTVLSHLKRCADSIKSHNNFPYLEERYIRELERISRIIGDQCMQQRSRLTESLQNSDVKDRLDAIFSNRIGSFYNDSQLNAIFSEGRVRAKELTPPYSLEGELINDRFKYHNLIIWKQIQSYAKRKNKSILLVTGKLNLGWYTIVENKAVSPRQELINEFYRNTRRYFYSLSLHDFVDEVCRKYNIVFPNGSQLLNQLEVEVESISMTRGGVDSNLISVVGTHSV